MIACVRCKKEVKRGFVVRVDSCPSDGTRLHEHVPEPLCRECLLAMLHGKYREEATS